MTMSRILRRRFVVDPDKLEVAPPSVLVLWGASKATLRYLRGDDRPS